LTKENKKLSEKIFNLNNKLEKKTIELEENNSKLETL